MLTSNLSTVVHSLQGRHCPPGLHFHQQNRGTLEVHETNSPHYPGFVIFACLLAIKWYLYNCFNFYFLAFTVYPKLRTMFWSGLLPLLCLLSSSSVPIPTPATQSLCCVCNTSILLPQALCTGCSFSLEASPLRGLFGLLPQHFFSKCLKCQNPFLLYLSPYHQNVNTFAYSVAFQPLE